MNEQKPAWVVYRGFHLHTVLPSFINIMVLVAFYVVVEGIIWVKTKRVMKWLAPSTGVR